MTDTSDPSGSGAAYGRAGDVNGDGQADIVLGNGQVRLATTATPDLISSISNGLGGSVSFTYKQLTDPSVYTPDTGSVFPIRDMKSQSSMYLVSQTSSSDGVGGQSVVNYSYGGAKTHAKGRGFLGFRWMQATNPDPVMNGLTTRTEFHQDFPFVGMPSLTKKTVTGGGNAGLLGQTTYSYWCQDFEGVDGCQVGLNKHYFSYLTTSVEQAWDLDGTVLPTSTTTNTFDCAGSPAICTANPLTSAACTNSCFGNLNAVTVSNDAGFGKTTTNQYANDTTSPHWFLGRLLRSTVTSTAP